MKLSFSTDGRYLATASLHNTKFWEVPSGRLAVTVGSFSAGYSPDGTLISLTVFTKGRDGTIEVRELKSGKVVATLSTGDSPAIGASFSSDGRYLLAESLDAPETLWEIPSGRLVATLSWDDYSDLSPDGRYVAKGTRIERGDKVAAWWLVPSGSLSGKLQIAPGSGNVASTFLPITPWNYTYMGGTTEPAGIWHLPSGVLVATLSDPYQFVTCVSFSPDGRYLATGNSDGTVRLWEPIG